MVVPVAGVTRSPVKAIVVQVGQVATKVRAVNLLFSKGMGVSVLESKNIVSTDVLSEKTETSS